ncbi:outer membrane lipoprotein chaperone LolA [Colwellia asteriadis]|uniref:Outer-membrane lipoprotein carrier protein n=1 Tax=Colwellia asteriadis TaxID=517723 RepID=A0ABN1L7V6_9GAMM
MSPTVLKKIRLATLLSIPVLSHFSVHAEVSVTPATKDTAIESVATQVLNTTDERSAQDKARLMATLSELTYFSADFTQKIFSESEELLQQGAGTLAISKPNLVNWQTTEPDETTIVSDGETLWFYDPFIEQASAYSLAKAIDNTPILLLTSDEKTLWDNYQVEQKNEQFVITPLNQESQIKSLSLRFSRNESSTTQLSEFSFKDATGQVSQILLSNFNSTDAPNAQLFSFSLPQGVRLEDKR